MYRLVSSGILCLFALTLFSQAQANADKPKQAEPEVLPMPRVVELGYFEEVRVQNAKLNIYALTMAARVYYVKNDKPPASLKDLTPYIEGGEKRLLDPWGKPYQLKVIEEDGGFVYDIYTMHPELGKIDKKTVVK